MSFLYEENTFYNLIGGLIKEAQTATTNIAKKLADKLNKELEGTFINITSPTASNLNIASLQSLGKLLQFLQTGQINLNGQRLSYTAEEYEKLPEDEKDKLSPVPVYLSRDALTRKWNTADYYINLNQLVKYISYLQQKAKSGNNKVLEVMVGKLVDQINDIKPDSGLTRKIKSEPGKPNELSDETILEGKESGIEYGFGFGSKIFDPKNPIDDRGAIPLRAKDIKSRESLNAWLRQGPEAQIIMYDKDNKPTTFLYTDPKADPCVVVGVLSARAKYALQYSTSSEQTKRAQYYLNKIHEVGQDFSSPDGKSCSLGTYIIPAAFEKEIKPGEKTDKKPGAKEFDVSFELVNQVVESLPLRTSDIDFERIQTFIGKYRQLMSPAHQAKISSLIQSIQSAMLNASNLTLENKQNFRLGVPVSEFSTWVKQPAGQYFKPLIDNLMMIVDRTADIINDFKTSYGNVISSSQLSLVNGQVGDSPNDYSISRRNYNELMLLRNQAKGKF